MSISSSTLTQAREALITAGQQKLVLLGQVKEQGRKIADLEREVQKQSTLLTQANQALAAAQTEIAALRAQLPDEATVRAHDALEQFLASPAETPVELRIAA